MRHAALQTPHERAWEEGASSITYSNCSYIDYDDARRIACSREAASLVRFLIVEIHYRTHTLLYPAFTIRERLCGSSSRVLRS